MRKIARLGGWVPPPPSSNRRWLRSACARGRLRRRMKANASCILQTHRGRRLRKAPHTTRITPRRTWPGIGRRSRRSRPRSRPPLRLGLRRGLARARARATRLVIASIQTRMIAVGGRWRNLTRSCLCARGPPQEDRRSPSATISTSDGLRVKDKVVGGKTICVLDAQMRVPRVHGTFASHPRTL